MEVLAESTTSPVGVVAAARAAIAGLTETLWAAARPEELLEVTVELERLRSLVAVVEARVAVEVEATEAVRTAGWVSPGDWLTAVAGGRHGHGSRLLRTARGLCGDRTATLAALQAGEVSPEHAEVIVGVLDRLPVESGLRDEAERLLLDSAASLNASELRKAIPAVLGTLGEVLDVGRSQRLVTPAIWKALVLRDRHCRFPGCRRMPLACDAHHLTHWAHGGPTSLDNLVILCRAHHTLLHATPWQARLNPVDRQPEFRPPPGRHRRSQTTEWIRELRHRE